MTLIGLAALCAICAWKWYKWRVLAETLSSFLDEKENPPTQKELEDRMHEVIRGRLSKGGNSNRIIPHS